MILHGVYVSNLIRVKHNGQCRKSTIPPRESFVNAKRSPQPDMGGKSSISSLPGMRYIWEEEWRRLRLIQDSLQEFLGDRGYAVVDTPVLEPSESFLRKSGGELASRMYTFTEPGGYRVSLRPEFTSSVIRLFVRVGGRGPFPSRWQYAGPVFRYDTPDVDSYRQYTQVGAEVIGASGAYADAEVVALGCEALMNLGVKGLRLTLGHVGVAHTFLRQFALSERARLFLLSSIPELKGIRAGLGNVRKRGEGLQLLRDSEGLESRPGGFDEESKLPDLQVLPKGIRNNPREGSALGVRTQEEVLERMNRKLISGDEGLRVERALSFINDLAQVVNEPSLALREARVLAEQHGVDPQPLSLVEESISALDMYELGDTKILLDFGLARDIAYYTGLIFEIDRLEDSGITSLGGGGRYDGLVKVLGGSEDMPALGFAWNLEQVVAALDESDSYLGPPPDSERVLVVPQPWSAYRRALQVADTLRTEGKIAEVALSEVDLETCLEYARNMGISAIFTVGENELPQRHLV